MKTYGTSGVCPKCGKQLYTSDVKGYSFVCKECDENFYTVETKECSGDFWEINVPATLDEFERNLSEWQEISNKYNCDFLGYDDVAKLMDIGWKNGFPESDILNKFVKEIEEQLKR